MTGPANSWSEQLGPGRPFEDASQKMERTVMEAKRKIITRYIFPPIPIRAFDWIAYENGCEEDGRYGYGRTEEEALADYRNNHEPPTHCSHCGRENIGVFGCSVGGCPLGADL